MGERWTEEAFRSFGVVDSTHDEKTSESRGELCRFEAEGAVRK